MTDKKYVLPRTQLWDQSIFNIRPLSLMYYCYYYYFQMGRELRALPWDVRNETLRHTPSMPSWKRETFQGLMGPATCTPFLSSSGHSLCFAFSRAFSAAGPRHCGLWEEWYSAFVRKGADFPGLLCVPDSFTNWQSGAAEHTAIQAVSACLLLPSQVSLSLFLSF